MPELVFDRIRHIYTLDGVRLPSVSRILREAGLAPDLSHIPPPVLDRARRRGIAVHHICEQMDRGDDPDVEPGLEPYVDAYQAFLREAAYRAEDTEQPVYHPELLYAGTLDARGWLGCRRAIIDRKATAALDSVATPVQLAAYTGAYLACHGEEQIDTVYALHLRRDGTYRLHGYAFDAQWPVWVAAYTIYRHKRQMARKEHR